MRWLCAILVLTLVWLQMHLWLSDAGYRRTVDIRNTVSQIRQENDTLRERNEALAAEVRNLKNGFEAAEERARSDLGLIGPRETFYQIVSESEPGT